MKKNQLKRLVQSLHHLQNLHDQNWVIRFGLGVIGPHHSSLSPILPYQTLACPSFSNNPWSV
jgi:hypothetical protein